MKSLLSPAIKLMNRLSFAMKFSLISALFFLPMLITNFYLVRDSYQDFISAFYVSIRASLRSLGQVMDQVAAGDLTAHFTVQSRDELGELGHAFRQYPCRGGYDC